jgi:hypothetical protein
MENNGNMLLLLMVKENIIPKVKRNILGQKLYAFQRQSQEINLQTLNKVMVIMVV